MPLRVGLLSTNNGDRFYGTAGVTSDKVDCDVEIYNAWKFRLYNGMSSDRLNTSS